MAGRKKSRAHKSWAEIRSLSDMSLGQWRQFQAKLTEIDLESLRDRLGFNKQSLDTLSAWRVRANKPSSTPSSLKKRFQDLLQVLNLTDELLQVFEGKIYFAPETQENSVPYVGKGREQRLERFSGHQIDVFTPTNNLHLECLEGLLLWLVRVARARPANSNYPQVCSSCEEAFCALASVFGAKFGHRLTRTEILDLARAISDHAVFEV